MFKLASHRHYSLLLFSICKQLVASTYSIHFSIDTNSTQGWPKSPRSTHARPSFDPNLAHRRPKSTQSSTKLGPSSAQACPTVTQSRPKVDPAALALHDRACLGPNFGPIGPEFEPKQIRSCNKRLAMASHGEPVAAHRPDTASQRSTVASFWQYSCLAALRNAVEHKKAALLPSSTKSCL